MTELRAHAAAADIDEPVVEESLPGARRYEFYHAELVQIGGRVRPE
jgi:hypothetical protein